MEMKYLIGTTRRGFEVFAKMDIYVMNGYVSPRIEFTVEKSEILEEYQLEEYLQEHFHYHMDAYQKVEELEKYDCKYSEFGEYWLEDLTKSEKIEWFESMLNSKNKEFDEVVYNEEVGEFYLQFEDATLESYEMELVVKDSRLRFDHYCQLLALSDILCDCKILEEEKETNPLYRKFRQLQNHMEELER